MRWVRHRECWTWCIGICAVMAPRSMWRCDRTMWYHQGRPCKLVIAEDVTERRHVDAELLQMAHHDALTGLPNRTLLSDRMNQAQSTAQRLKHKTAVISIDLDHFKKVNDWYGHAIGDAYLKHVAGLLTSRLRGMDTVARMGGDEFAIVLGEISTVESAALVGKMLLQALNKPTVIGGYTIQPRGSLGIAIYPDHGTDMDEVWRCADAAMYRAKRAGGNRYIVAGPDCVQRRPMIAPRWISSCERCWRRIG